MEEEEEGIEAGVGAAVAAGTGGENMNDCTFTKCPKKKQLKECCGSPKTLTKIGLPRGQMFL